MFDTLLTGIQAIKNQVDQQTANDSSLYIPLQATTSSADNAERFDLQQGMLQFLNLTQNAARSNEAKVLLLLGDTGSGKSMFAQNFYRHLWQQYQPGQAIPLWLPLPELQNPFGEAVEEVLLNFGFDKAQVAELKSQHQFIIIADGYDELHSWQNIYMSNHLAEWNAKVIVTCRSQAVYHIRDFEKYFTPYRDEQPIRHLLSKHFVAPFSENQIDLYLQQYQRQQDPANNQDDDDNDDDNGKNPGLTQAKLRAIPGLSDLIITPFLLHLAVEALPDILIRFQHAEITQQSKLTLAALYDVFIERWFNRQVIKLIATKQISENEDFKPKLWQFCQSLASKMHQQNISHVPYSSATSTAKKSLFGKSKTEANPWAAFFSAENTLLRSGCPLRQFGENTYGFVHASFVEYFATRAMYVESLVKSSDANDATVTATATTTSATPTTIATTTSSSSSTMAEPAKPADEEPPSLNEGIHYRLFTQEPNAIRMLADRVLQYPAFKTKLFEHIEKSKTDPRYATGAANAITALNCAGVSFSGMDLQNIKVAQANLQNVLMDYTDLAGADLTGINFKNACLTNANLSRAKLEAVAFDEAAYINLHHQRSDIKISPDDNLIAIRTLEDVIIFNKQTLQVIPLLQGSTGLSTCICFFPDGNTLISVHNDRISFWNTTTGLAINQPFPGASHYMLDRFTISPDGSMLAHGQFNKKIHLYNMRTQQTWGEQFDSGLHHVSCLTFSPESELLAYCGDLSIKVLSLNTRTILDGSFRGHSKHINVIAFSSNSNYLISGSQDESIRIWDVATGNAVKVINNAHNKAVISLAVSLDGNTFASGSEDHVVNLWELQSGTSLGEPLTGHTQTVTSLAFTLDGTMLLSGSKDDTIRLWHIKTNQPKLLENIQYHKSRVGCIASSNNGKYVASSGEATTIILWETTGNRAESELLIGHELAVYCLAFSPDGRILASGSADQTVRLWYTESKMLFSSPLKDHQGRVTAIAYSPDGTKLASSSIDETIVIRDATTLGILFKLMGHHRTIFSIMFLSDNCSLVSASLDKSIRLWDATTGQQKETLNQFDRDITAIAWSSNGEVLALGEGNTISLWNRTTQDGSSQKRLVGHSDLVAALSFSPSNFLLASASQDSTLRIWDISTTNNHSEQILRGHTQGVTNVTFMTNEKLVSGSQDYSIRIWQLKWLGNKGKIWITLWRSRPYVLQIMDANLNETKGLSHANQTLLEQRGAQKLKLTLPESNSNLAVPESSANLAASENSANLAASESSSIITTTENINSLPNFNLVSLTTRAIKQGNIEEARRLIKLKDDIDQVDSHGDTFLSQAVLRGRTEVAQLLIDANANVNQTEQLGQPLLIIAIREHHTELVRLELVRLLIGANANVNQADNDGRTPLHFAVDKNLTKVVQMLIDAKANVNKTDNISITPLESAIRRGYSEVVQLLINANADVNQAVKYGLTPLHTAVLGNHVEIVQLLLKAKANLDQADKSGNTALHMTANSGRTEIAQLLINANANVNQPDNTGETPLHKSAQSGHPQITRLLINANADIHLPKNNGETPLFVAAEYDKTDVLKLLIKMKAKINQAREDGTTPLLIALSKGNADAAKLLLEAGADVSLASKDGTTPLLTANEKGYSEIVDLIRHAFSTNQPTASLTDSSAESTTSTPTTWERARPAEDATISSTNIFSTFMQRTSATSEVTKQTVASTEDQSNVNELNDNNERTTTTDSNALALESLSK